MDSDAPGTAHHGAVLARGAFFNALAFFASNLRGIFTFLVARLLGSVALGTFGLAWSVTDLVSKLGTAGMDTAAIPAVAEHELSGDVAGSRRVLRASLTISLSTAFVLMAAAVLVTRVLPAWNVASPELLRATGLMLFALPGVVLYRVSNALSRGKGVMHHDVYSRGFTESLGTTAVLLVAIAVGFRRLAPEVAAIGGTLASGIVAFLVARPLFMKAPVTPLRTGEVRALVGRSVPIAFYDLCNIGIMQVDLIMLGLFVGHAPGVTAETLGIYTAATEIAGGLRKVNSAFNPIFAPIVAQQISAGRIDKAEESYAYLARWMLGILLPAVIGMAIGSDALMSIFGPSFRGGTVWLMIVATACALNAFVGLGETILMIKRPAVNLFNSATALSITVGANLILIPRYGPLGAAIGMLIPYSIQGILRGVEIPLLFKWRWPWRELQRPWVAAIAAAPVPILLRLYTGRNAAAEVGAMALYLGSYFLVWRIMGLDPSDRAVLRHLMGRDEPSSQTA
ncbi:MAG TPA: oligosaccharide flippase family protein [Vicinamibacterales bacterium]|jgi:O-antigen/teichoic acid export membrane protein|nr:oligosaccharide flippase family protein [Vicinamibacterales bacterium]